MITNINDLIDSVGVGIKYHIVELTEILPFDSQMEPIVKYTYHIFKSEATKLLTTEKENENRAWDYRVFEKQKVSDCLITELGSMNKLNLIGWLS